MAYNLTTVDKVKEIAGIQAGEISDTELTNYITDISSRIYDKYGRPLATFSETGSPAGSYLLAGEKQRITVLNTVELDSTELNLGTDYTYVTEDGEITLGSDLTAGSLVVDYTPEMYYLLATFGAAEKALEAMYVFTGDQVNNTRLEYVRNQKMKLITDHVGKGIAILTPSSSLMTGDISTEVIRDSL